MGQYTVRREDVAAYHRDGVVCLRGVLAPDEVARVRERCVELVPAAGDPNTPFRERMMLATQVRGFWSLCGALPEIAAQVMDSTVVRYYNDHFFVKEPGVTAPTLFHQDGTYWPFRGDMISTWLGLSHVTEDASPVTYVAGSHKSGKFYRPASTVTGGDRGAAALEPCPDYFDPDVAAGAKILSWETEPGDVLVHHPFIVHGAAKNRSADGRSRIALTVRFLGDGVVWDPRSYTPMPDVAPDVAPGEYPGDDAAFPVVWDGGPVEPARG